MTRYVPPILTPEMLEAHVNRHTKLGFKMFEVSILRGVNISNLQRLFDNKGRRTLKRWIELYADGHSEHQEFLTKTYNLKEGE